MKQLITMLCILLVTGCQVAVPLSAKNDPKSEWWELAFTEPDYMKVWVENSSVQDIITAGFSTKPAVALLRGENLKMVRSPPEVGQVG
jgi:hypothetical protein